MSNNKVYLVGSTNRHVMAYDPSADSYIQKNNFPDSVAVTGFVINGDGYCIAGNGNCWKYDAATDSWQQKSGLPASVWNITGFLLNNYGYVIGDLNLNTYNNSDPIKLWRYTPSLNVWQ